MDDVDSRLSNLILAYAAFGAGLNLADSIRTRGIRRSLVLLALGTGLPAVGELLATGALGLLRHRTRPRVAGVPFAVLLGWYNVIHGSFTLAERILSRLPLDEGPKGRVLPPVAALVGISLDLVLDPAGLDAGLWEWNSDGSYAREIEGANGNTGVPAINYLGWLALVAGATYSFGLAFGREKGREGSSLPVLILLSCYLAAVAWAVGRRRPKYLLYSLPFPVALYAGLEEG
ncbi:MAG: carotenoid biosynthesis protein [Rubrobacter sp.]